MKFSLILSLVIHCASPFQLSVSDPQKDLIDPALKGTTNVMETALECGVKVTTRPLSK